MAKITWLGEGISPPPSLDWRGITFPLGQPVDVDDPTIVAKAKTAPSIFKVVEEAPASPPKPKPPPEPEPEPEPQPGDNHEDEDEDEPPRRAEHVSRGRAVPTHHATRKKK